MESLQTTKIMDNSVKQEILTAVSCGETLTPEQIKALTEVLSTPYTKETLVSTLNFNHIAPNTYQACGISEEEVNNAQEEFKAIVSDFEGTKRSSFIQQFFDKASLNLVRVIIIENLCQKMEGPEKKPSLEEILKKLGGM